MMILLLISVVCSFCFGAIFGASRIIKHMNDLDQEG